MHEDPQVPNYYDGPKPRLKPGLVIAIEPMINMGGLGVEVLSDPASPAERELLLAGLIARDERGRHVHPPACDPLEELVVERR